MADSPPFQLRTQDLIKTIDSTNGRIHQFSSVAQGIWLFVTPWTAAPQASLSITNSRGLLNLMSIELAMLSSHLILCHPLLLLPSIFPSIRVFSNESLLCIRCPKYWSFSFSISPYNEHSGLISFRMDWLDLLAGTLKSLLQYHSSKASILWQSAFFIVQLSHPYMTTLITHHILLINLSFYILYFTHSRVCRAYMSRVGWILTNDTCVTITQLRYIRIFFFTPWKIPFQSILTSYPHFSLKHIFRFWSV